MENTNNEVSKEIGKWLMDIAKYIATAVLVAGFFGNIGETWQIFVVGAGLTALFLVFGIILFRNQSPKK